MEFHNSALIHDESLMSIIKVLEWEWPAGPSFLYAIGSFVEAAVIHDKLFFDPMRQTLDNEATGNRMPDFLNQSAFVQLMIREGVLTVFPNRTEIDQHLQQTQREYSFENFLLDFYWGFASFSSADPEGDVSELSALIDLTQKAPSVLMTETLINRNLSAIDNSLVNLSVPGLMAYTLGFSQDDLQILEERNRKSKAFLDLTNSLRINFYPAFLAIPYQVGTVKAFNSKAKSIYKTIVDKVVSQDDELIENDEFYRVPIPPLAQIAMKKSQDSIVGFMEEIVELRNRHRTFRSYLTDYERTWNTASTRRERIKLNHEFNNAWKALVTNEERPSTRIIYTLWDILKNPLNILSAIGDKLRKKGHELSVIGRARGLHDFWKELVDSPIPQKNLELLSNLIPKIASDKEWQLSRDLANSVNTLMKTESDEIQSEQPKSGSEDSDEA